MITDIKYFVYKLKNCKIRDSWLIGDIVAFTHSWVKILNIMLLNILGHFQVIKV